MSSSAAVSSDNTRSFKVPANLGEFNQILNGLGLESIPRSVMTMLKAREPRQRLLDALRRATDAGEDYALYLAGEILSAVSRSAFLMNQREQLSATVYAVLGNSGFAVPQIVHVGSGATETGSMHT